MMGSDSPTSGHSSSPHLHLGLFAITVITLFAGGLLASGYDPFEPTRWTAGGLQEAAAYMLWALAILAAHEAGHYRAATRRGVDTSYPYFLPGLGPIPGVGVIPFFGTFGAFMKMKMEEVSASDLTAIAGWGPVAGFAVTVPAVFVGVALSEPIAVDPEEGMLILGDPLLIEAATALFHPELEPGMELMLHPIGLAGWVGCLLTALNLLPVGQLDGGHLLYGVFGDRSHLATWVVFGALIAVGLWFFPGWLVLAVLIGWMGVRHPPILKGTPLRCGERWMVWICVVIFAVTFTPQPVEVPGLPELLWR